MSNVNIMAGWPQHALDSLADQLYPIFKDKLEGKFVDSSVIPIEIDYRVAAPPRIILRPSDDAAETLRARAANVASAESGVPLDQFIDAVANAPGTFTLRCDPVIVGVKMKQGERQEFRMRYDALCRIEWKLVGKDRYWWPHVVSSRARLDPPDPEAEKVLNEIVLPMVEPLINEKLEKEKLKAISYGGLTFAPPEVRTYPEAMATFLSLRAPTVPPDRVLIRNPRRSVVQMDSEFLETFINDELRKTQVEVPRQCTSTGGWTACVWAAAGLRNTRIQLIENNVALASMEAYGSGHVSLQLWNFDPLVLGASISGTPISILRLEAEDGWIKVTCIVREVKIRLDIHGLPSWLNWLISEVLSFLTSAIATPISAFISLFRPGIFKPDHELEYFGRKIVIKLDQMKLDTFRAPDSKIVFEASGVGVAIKG